MVPGPVVDALGDAAREAGVYLVIGVNERDQHGATIYNTVLYFSPDGSLVGKHRKLMPTGSERTVWGMGDGSTLPVVDTGFGRISGLICWENYMPLARYYLYAQGVDIWVAPTLAPGDAWIATLRHIAREGRCYVLGINPCLRVDQIPADFPGREQVWPDDPDGDGWVEHGNSVIIGPNGEILAGPAREEEAHPHSPRSTSTKSMAHGGCSTRPGTTTGPTCSVCRSTPVRAQRSSSTKAEAHRSSAWRRPLAAGTYSVDLIE